MEGKGEIFDDREVRVHETRAIYGSASSRAKFPGRSLDKSAGIEPVLFRVNRCWATGLPTFVASLIRISDLVWALQRKPVVREESSRLLRAVDDKQRKARRRPLNEVKLPIPQDRVGALAPSPSELLAAAERQVVQHASRKAAVQVQFRESPVQVRRSRQGIIQRARIGSQTVRQAGIEIARVGIADQSVQAVLCALGLSLYLQRIVARRAHGIVAIDGLEGAPQGLVDREGEEANAATHRIASHHPACPRIVQILVHLAHQNMVAARSGVPYRE